MSRPALLGAALVAAAISALAQTQPVTITTAATLPVGYAGIYYGAPQVSGLQFSAILNPSQATVTWSLAVVPGTNSANPLPPGLTLTPSGFFSGTPTTVGTYQFALAATTPYGGDVKIFTLNVVAPTVTITSQGPLPGGVVGKTYAFTFFANASPPIGLNWFVSTGSLPPGLSLTTINSQGILTGTPSAVGSYQFTVAAQLLTTDLVAQKAYNIDVTAGQVVINTTSLPPAPVFQAYASPPITASPAGATLRVVTGSNLPPGISFNAQTSQFVGNPTTPGSYLLQIQADYPGYASDLKLLTIYVTYGPLRIVENSLPIAIQNSLYQVTLTPSGGLPPFQWAFGAANSAGMSIDAKTGTITGTPTTLGNFPLLVTLSDLAGETFTESLTLTVATPVVILTASLPAAAVGSPYSQVLQAGGGQAPFGWALVSNSGSLPPGLTLSAGGVISGTPTTNGTYNFSVQVTDTGQRTATKALTITVGAAANLTITTISLPDGVIAVPYSATLNASGGTPAYIWSVASGVLPPGLSIDARSGVISGTPPPTALGNYLFTIQVTDSTFGNAATAQKTFTIAIGLPLSINTTSLPNATVGSAYSATLQASGGKPPYTWSLGSGTLPAGVQLNATTGAITGTPAASSAGTATVLVIATDSNGQSARQSLTLTVSPVANPPAFTGGSFSATLGSPFSQTLTASGGTSPYTFAVTSGTLPAGISLSSSGALAGTPAAPGSSAVTVTVTDANQQTASATVTISVALPPTPAVTVSVGSGSPQPAQQSPVAATLNGPLPLDATGTLTVSFQSSVGGGDQTVQFITPGGRSSSVNFTVPKGATQLVLPSGVVLATGTTAGTITITTAISVGGVPLSPAPAPTTLTIAPAAPVIQSVALASSGNTVTVTVIGFTNTHEAVSGDFVFASATNTTVAQPDIVVQLGPVFATYFQTAASNTFGGQFKLTVPFTLTNGTGAQITAVRVTLTNARGTSAAVTP